ncbi:hypothetical protein LTR95_013328 [Oleoguttula sp. CCFEE 5521]
MTLAADASRLHVFQRKHIDQLDHSIPGTGNEMTIDGCVEVLVSGFDHAGVLLAMIAVGDATEHARPQYRLLENSMHQAATKLESALARSKMHSGATYEHGNHTTVATLQQNIVELQSGLLKYLTNAKHSDIEVDFSRLLDVTDSIIDRSVDALDQGRHRLVEAEFSGPQSQVSDTQVAPSQSRGYQELLSPYRLEAPAFPAAAFKHESSVPLLSLASSSSSPQECRSELRTVRAHHAPGSTRGDHAKGGQFRSKSDEPGHFASADTATFDMRAPPSSGPSAPVKYSPTLAQATVTTSIPSSADSPADFRYLEPRMTCEEDSLEARDVHSASSKSTNSDTGAPQVVLCPGPQVDGESSESQISSQDPKVDGERLYHSEGPHPQNTSGPSWKLSAAEQSTVGRRANDEVAFKGLSLHPLSHDTRSHARDPPSMQVRLHLVPPITVNTLNVPLHVKLHWRRAVASDLSRAGSIYLGLKIWAPSPSGQDDYYSRTIQYISIALFRYASNVTGPLTMAPWPASSEPDVPKNNITQREAERSWVAMSAIKDRLALIAIVFTALGVMLVDLYIGCRPLSKVYLTLPLAVAPIELAVVLLLFTSTSFTLETAWRNLTPEPPLGAKMTRIRWRCGCGRSMHDDYKEIKPGAMLDLQRSLDHKRSHGAPNGTSGNALNTILRSLKGVLLPNAGGPRPQLPQHNQQAAPTTRATGNSAKAPPLPTDPDQFLLLCVPFKRHATKLSHVPTPAPISDTDFFRLLRLQYTTLRGRFRRIFSLRTLAELRFVQFEVFRNDLADVRKLDVIPPGTQKDEYIYNPMPAAFIPPIGKNQLRHLYDHPEDADDESVCFNRVPRKLHERLVAAPIVGSSEGWGICFIEGVSWPKVCIFGLVGVVFSTAFGVLWTVLKDDIQGGFGVASFMLGVLALSVGALQGALEM